MKTYFLWIDCEMTGLDFRHDHILELAFVLTDVTLSPLCEKKWVIHHDHCILKNMNEWSKNQHTLSGLTDEVQFSSLSYKDVEMELINILKKFHLDEKVVIYIAGNSVYHDVLFLKQHMSGILSYCHYRLLDVSSLKIMIQVWGDKKYIPEKKETHRAINDIYESINELRVYRKLFFSQLKN